MRGKLWYGKLYSSEKGRSKTIYSSMTQTYVVRKNPDIKEHAMYDYIYIKYKDRQTDLCHQKSEQWLLLVGERANNNWTGYREGLWGAGNMGVLSL